MQSNTIIIGMAVLVLGLVLASCASGGKDADKESFPKAKVAVFFGSVGVMDIETIQSNALVELGKNGLIPPVWSERSFNIQLGGRLPGCFVSFYDLTNDTVYQVHFDGTGKVVKALGVPRQQSYRRLDDAQPDMPPDSIKKTIELSPKDGKEYE